MKCNLKKCDIAGAILAGGDARRLGGIAKGAIEIDDGTSVIERLIEELTRAGICDIVIVANNPAPYQHYGVEIVSDNRAGIGPMGGIETGLGFFAGRYDAVMFMPCDLPNITASEMLALKKAFVESGVSVVFAETADFFWHPLCAVVHNGLAKDISTAIDRGRRKIRDVWRQVKALPVHFDNESAFFNINTLADMDRWRKG